MEKLSALCVALLAFALLLLAGCGGNPKDIFEKEIAPQVKCNETYTYELQAYLNASRGQGSDGSAASNSLEKHAVRIEFPNNDSFDLNMNVYTRGNDRWIFFEKGSSSAFWTRQGSKCCACDWASCSPVSCGDVPKTPDQLEMACANNKWTEEDGRVCFAALYANGKDTTFSLESMNVCFKDGKVASAFGWGVDKAFMASIQANHSEVSLSTPDSTMNDQLLESSAIPQNAILPLCR